MDTPPFFLVGSERSGTTLLRLMLAHHPSIECAPEFEFLVDFLPPEGGGPRGDGWPDVAAYAEYLSTNRIFLPHGMEVDTSQSFPELAAGFVHQYCAPSGKPLHGATCHHAFDALPRIFPEARFVHLIRDGRDVARSCIGMGWASNVWFGADRWIEALGTWERLRSRVDDARCFELRYEDLIADCEKELGRLCEFLGQSYAPSMLDYVEDSTYGLPDPSLIEQWRDKLSEEELSLLEARIGPLLRSHGYPESGVAPAAVDGLRMARLTWSNRLGMFKKNRTKYGLPLIVKGRLARGLGLRGLARSVQLERNSIDNEHIR